MALPSCALCLADLIAPPPFMPASDLAALRERFAPDGSFRHVGNAFQCGSCSALYCSELCALQHGAAHVLLCTSAADPAPPDDDEEAMERRAAQDVRLFRTIYPDGSPEPFLDINFLMAPSMVFASGPAMPFAVWRRHCLRHYQMRDRLLADPERVWLQWAAYTDARLEAAHRAGGVLAPQASVEERTAAAEAHAAGVKRVWLLGSRVRLIEAST